MFDFLWPILNVFILADWTDFNHSPCGHQTLVIGQVNLADDHLPLYLLLKRESKLPTVKPENSSMLTQRAGVQRGPRFLSACYIQNSQQFDSRPWRTANALFHRWQLQLSAVCVNKSSETHKRHSRLSRARLIRFVRFTSQQVTPGSLKFSETLKVSPILLAFAAKCDSLTERCQIGLGGLRPLCLTFKVIWFLRAQF